MNKYVQAILKKTQILQVLHIDVINDIHQLPYSIYYILTLSTCTICYNILQYILQNPYKHKKHHITTLFRIFSIYILVLITIKTK